MAEPLHTFYENGAWVVPPQDAQAGRGLTPDGGCQDNNGERPGYTIPSLPLSIFPLDGKMHRQRNSECFPGLYTGATLMIACIMKFLFNLIIVTGRKSSDSAAANMDYIFFSILREKHLLLLEWSITIE